MPVITTYDPLSQGLDAAAGFVQGGNDARDKALALARAREQTEYDRSEDQKRDKATQDTFDESKSEFGQTHSLDVQRTESEIVHTKNQDQIAAAVEDTRKAMAPLLKRSQELQNAYSAGELTTQQLQQRTAAIAADTATEELKITRKYGEVNAQLAIAQATANIGSTNAGTASTQQATAFGAIEEPSRLTGFNLANQATALANQYGATSGSSSNVGEAYQRLSTQGRAFYDMLTTTNNPATTGQALAALNKSGLPSSDKTAIALMLSKKGASVVTPAEQRAANKTAKANPAQGLVGLPAPVQDVIIKQRKQGVDDAAILQMIDGSKLPDDVKNTAKRALTASVASQSVAAGGGSQDAAPFLGSLGL